LLVDEDFGGNDVAERHEGLQEVVVGELRREVVDEKIAALRAWGRKQKGQLWKSGSNHGTIHRHSALTR